MKNISTAFFIAILGSSAAMAKIQVLGSIDKGQTVTLQTCSIANLMKDGSKFFGGKTSKVLAAKGYTIINEPVKTNFDGSLDQFEPANFTYILPVEKITNFSMQSSNKKMTISKQGTWGFKVEILGQAVAEVPVVEMTGVSDKEEELTGEFRTKLAELMPACKKQ